MKRKYIVVISIIILSNLLLHQLVTASYVSNYVGGLGQKEFLESEGDLYTVETTSTGDIFVKTAESITQYSAEGDPIISIPEGSQHVKLYNIGTKTIFAHQSWASSYNSTDWIISTAYHIIDNGDEWEIIRNVTLDIELSHDIGNNQVLPRPWYVSDGIKIGDSIYIAASLYMSSINRYAVVKFDINTLQAEIIPISFQEEIFSFYLFKTSSDNLGISSKPQWYWLEANSVELLERYQLDFENGNYTEMTVGPLECNSLRCAYYFKQENYSKLTMNSGPDHMVYTFSSGNETIRFGIEEQKYSSENVTSIQIINERYIFSYYDDTTDDKNNFYIIDLQSDLKLEFEANPNDYSIISSIYALMTVDNKLYTIHYSSSSFESIYTIMQYDLTVAQILSKVKSNSTMSFVLINLIGIITLLIMKYRDRNITSGEELYPEA